MGITTDMRARETVHKSRSKSWGTKVHQFIREHGGWENWDMIEIEETDDKTRERHWIEELGASLNTEVPGRNAAEWYKDNKDERAEYIQKNRDKLLEYHREYRENNKEKIKQYKSQKITCECGSVYTRGDKTQHLRTQKHQDYLKNGV